MYAVWVKIGETMPWIELEGMYKTKTEAQKAAKEILSKVQVKIVRVEVKGKPMKAVVMAER
jgi:hypothetical protein